MKIILFGAGGTVGSKIQKKLAAEKHDVITVGRHSGDHHADMTDAKSLSNFFETIGKFDAVVCAAGEVAFAPLEKLTDENWKYSFGNKLQGQINLVQKALPYINDQGSFTLVSGVLSDEPILAGVAATTVNRAIEGFVMAAACELPRGIRINVISPGLLTESKEKYAGFFPGFETVGGDRVAEAYLKSILGVQTGQTIRVI